MKNHTPDSRLENFGKFWCQRPIILMCFEKLVDGNKDRLTSWCMVNNFETFGWPNKVINEKHCIHRSYSVIRILYIIEYFIYQVQRVRHNI